MSQSAMYINSLNRSTGTNENFTIVDTSNRYSIQPQFVKLTRATIPFTWYNIASTNNTFALIIPPGPTVDISLPPGNYTNSSLATELQTELLSNGLTATVTYNPSTLTYTITSATPFQLSFATLNSIALQMGFTPQSTTSVGTSFTSPNASQLSNYYEIFICSDLVGGIDNGYTTLSPGSASNKQVLAIIPINPNLTPGSLLEFNTPDNEPSFPITQSNWGQNTTSPRTIHFFLQFPDGTSISLNGNFWTAVLTFYFSSV